MTTPKMIPLNPIERIHSGFNLGSIRSDALTKQAITFRTDVTTIVFTMERCVPLFFTSEVTTHLCSPAQGAAAAGSGPVYRAPVVKWRMFIEMIHDVAKHVMLLIR